MTVMLMMSVLSLLVLANMRLITVSLKHHYQWHRYEERAAHLEYVADHLANAFARHPAKQCVIFAKEDHPWRADRLYSACVFDTTYRYGVTDLGILACVKSAGSKEGGSTHHWLLSVIDMHWKNHMIQIRIATLGPQEPCPATDVSVIRPGVLTWRYL